MKLKFWVEEYSQTIDDAISFEVTDSIDRRREKKDLAWITEKFAHYYHRHYGGWEHQWPIRFSVADENNNFLAVVEVERETVPEFWGQVIRTSTDKKPQANPSTGG